jgi:hypothetical protein
MNVECAWCGKSLGEKEPLSNKNVTHGICEDCFNLEIPEIYKQLATKGGRSEREKASQSSFKRVEEEKEVGISR